MLALKPSVCWWTGVSTIILTMVVAAHRSTILDKHKRCEGCDYFIRGYAAISDYPIVCCSVGNVRRHLVVALVVPVGDEVVLQRADSNHGAPLESDSNVCDALISTDASGGGVLKHMTTQGSAA